VLFAEILQHIIQTSDAIAQSPDLSPVERAALTLVGVERFDALRINATIHDTLEGAE